MSSTADDLLQQGFQARREHRPSDARRNFIDAIEAADEPASLATALTELGRLERDERHLDAARQRYQEAAAVYRTLDEPLRLAHTVRHVGDILRDDGQLEPARPCYEEALRIYRTHAQTPSLDLANAIRGFALLQADTGDPKAAVELWREAKELYAMVQVEAGVAEANRRIAALKGHEVS